MSTDKIKDAINKYKSVEREQVKQPTSYDIPKQNTYQPEMYKRNESDLIVGCEVVKLPSKELINMLVLVMMSLKLNI